MKITYTGTMRGKKLYTVTDGLDRFFTGTLDEVKTYIAIHNQKVKARKDASNAVLVSFDLPTTA